MNVGNLLFPRTVLPELRGVPMGRSPVANNARSATFTSGLSGLIPRTGEYPSIASIPATSTFPTGTFGAIHPRALQILRQPHKS
jgi:hypothetical protein